MGLCGQQGGHNQRTGRLGSVLAEPCPVSLPGAQLPSGHVCAEWPETWRAASEDLANRECGSHVADTPTPPQEGTCGDPPDEESRETSPGQPQRPGAQAGSPGQTPAPQIFIKWIADRGIQITCPLPRLERPRPCPQRQTPRCPDTVTPTSLPGPGRARCKAASEPAAPSVRTRFPSLRTPQLLRVMQQ